MQRVTKDDFWVLYVALVRYAMGRSSYLPTLCAEFYSKYKYLLNKGQRQQIVDEITHELDLANQDGVVLGTANNHYTWMELVNQIKEDVE